MVDEKTPLEAPLVAAAPVAAPVPPPAAAAVRMFHARDTRLDFFEALKEGNTGKADTILTTDRAASKLIERGFGIQAKFADTLVLSNVMDYRRWLLWEHLQCDSKPNPAIFIFLTKNNLISHDFLHTTPRNDTLTIFQWAIHAAASSWNRWRRANIPPSSGLFAPSDAKDYIELCPLAELHQRAATHMQILNLLVPIAGNLEKNICTVFEKLTAHGDDTIRQQFHQALIDMKHDRNLSVPEPVGSCCRIL
jgi:hypothetical protein